MGMCGARNLGISSNWEYNSLPYSCAVFKVVAMYFHCSPDFWQLLLSVFTTTN